MILMLYSQDQLNQDAVLRTRPSFILSEAERLCSEFSFMNTIPRYMDVFWKVPGPPVLVYLKNRIFILFSHSSSILPKLLSAQVRGGSLAQGYFYMLMLRFQHMPRLKKVENLWAILSSFYIIA